MTFRILLPLLLAAATVSAAPFAPTPLRISAPTYVSYGFDLDPVTIPLTVDGGPASVTFALFTRDRASAIRNIRSGHLGWHYVNRIDTCFYLSPPYSCTPGQNTVTWNGRDDDGQVVPPGDYTFYLWGVEAETTSGKSCVDSRFPGLDRSALVMYDGSGNPLANPVLFSAAQSLDHTGETWNTRARWTLGGDPDDLSLLETTRYFTRPDRGRMAVSSENPQFFFTQALEPGAVVTRAWQWIPNGDAVLRTNWGDDGDGVTSVPSGFDPDTVPYSGPVTDRTGYLFSTVLAPGNTGSFPALDYIDPADGTFIKRQDLSPWPETEGTPTELAYRYGRLLLSSPGSVIFRAVEPVAGLDDESNFIQWENGVGDGFADGVGVQGTPRGVSMDQNGFAIFAENGPAPSIGVFAPDGTGVGYFSLSGLTDGLAGGLHIIDTGSPFDGLYYAGGDSAGVRYAGYDVFKGVLSGNIDCFGPPVSFTERPTSDPLSPGATVDLAWNYCGWYMNNVTVRILVSFDNRQTWVSLSDSTASQGEMEWVVPPVSSSVCWLRINDFHTDEIYETWGPFIISGPVAVSDDAPRAFALRQNTPNPFNPSTTLSFTLPAPGNVSLTVYDATGRKFTELARGFFTAGEHSAVWNAEGCASGVYFAVLRAGERSETRKMLLVR